jgi:putative PIN family toxin of toxin-antitoxin system
MRGFQISKFIVSETARKLRKKFCWEEAELQHELRVIVRKAEIVEPKTIPRAVPNDPDDDHVVACAIEGQADLIVSGDRDLLSLDEYQGIQVVRPMDFLRMVGGPKE